GLPRVALERSGVLPLRGEAERRSRRNRKDLVVGGGPCVRQLDAEPVEQREVRAKLDLASRLRLEVRVASLAEAASARAAAVRLVLRRELRRVAGCSIRRAETEVGEMRNLEPRLLRHTPYAGHAAERRPAIARAEERAAVVPIRAVENV